MTTDKLNLLFQPQNIQQRLRLTPAEKESVEFSEVRQKITDNDIENWTNSCRKSLETNDLMKLDAQLSYSVLLPVSAYQNCLNVINKDLLGQLEVVRNTALSIANMRIENIEQYFKLPVFFSILDELSSVNPEIYNQQFDAFVEVESSLKEQDKHRYIRPQFKLPLSEDRKEKLKVLQEKARPANEVNDSKNNYPLWVTILIVVFLILRVILRMSH